MIPARSLALSTCRFRWTSTRQAGPPVLAGPPGAVAAGLSGFVRAGFTALNFITAGPPADEQAERLAREVLPEVAAAI